MIVSGDFKPMIRSKLVKFIDSSLLADLTKMYVELLICFFVSDFSFVCSIHCVTDPVSIVPTILSVANARRQMASGPGTVVDVALADFALDAVVGVINPVIAWPAC